MTRLDNELECVDANDAPLWVDEVAGDADTCLAVIRAIAQAWELLSRRRKGEFVSGERMDERLAAMLSKRRANLDIANEHPPTRSP